MLKINLEKIKIAFILALVILNSGYALALGYQLAIMMLSMLFMISDILISRKTVKVTKGSLTFLILMFLQFGLACLVNFDIAGIAEYLRLMGVFLFGYYIFISFSPKDLVWGFAGFMFFLAVVSLIFYVWISFFPSYAIKVQNGYGTEYMTCFLAFVNTASLERNCGVFWEPSVFAAMCFIWGIIEICIIRNVGQRKWRIVVLIVTIFTTYSTSGYVYLLLLFVIFILRNDSKGYKFYRVVAATAMLLIGVVVYLNFDTILLKLVDINALVFKKLLLNNVSVTDRIIGPLADLYVAVRNPLGVGLTTLTPTVQYVAATILGITINTRTSTITYYCAAFGLLSGITVMVPLMNFVRRNVHAFLLMLVVAVGLIFMSISAPMHDSAVFIILLFLGTQKNITATTQTNELVGERKGDL